MPIFISDLVQAKLDPLSKNSAFSQFPTTGRELELIEVVTGNKCLCSFTDQPHNLGKLPAQLSLCGLLCVMNG